MWSLGLYIISLFFSIAACGLCGIYLFSALLPMLKISTGTEVLSLLINGYCLGTGSNARCVILPFSQQFENVAGSFSVNQPATGNSLTAETLVRDYALLNQPAAFLTCFIVFILMGIVVLLLAFNTSSGRIPTKFVRVLFSTLLVLASFISAVFIGIVVIYYGKLGEQAQNLSFSFNSNQQSASSQISIVIEKGIGQYLLSVVLAATVFVTVLILWKSCARRKDHPLNETLKAEPLRASTVSHTVPIPMTTEPDAKEHATLTRWNPEAHYLQYSEDPYRMYNSGQVHETQGYSVTPLYYVPSYSHGAEAANGNMYRPYSIVSANGMMPYVSNYMGNEARYSGSYGHPHIAQQDPMQFPHEDNDGVIAHQSMAPADDSVKKEDTRFTAAPSEFAPFPK